MKRLLLVDDDPDILASLGMLLGETYDVACASDGEQALAMLAEKHFDAVVLDLMMPVVDGEGVMHELAARKSTVPVLLVSAARDLRGRARDLRAADYLPKPFDADQLEAKIARVLAMDPGGSGSTNSGGDQAKSPPPGSTPRNSAPRSGEQAVAWV